MTKQKVPWAEDIASQAQSIVDSPVVLSVSGAPQWHELSNDGQEWIRAIINETAARAALAAQAPSKIDGRYPNAKDDLRAEVTTRTSPVSSNSVEAEVYARGIEDAARIADEQSASWRKIGKGFMAMGAETIATLIRARGGLTEREGMQRDG